MTGPTTETLCSGLPYNRMGHGPRVVVVFQGLAFENRRLSDFELTMVRDYEVLADEFTVYLAARRPGLPAGYSLKDMADDYALMIREEFGGPVDVIGMSTGGRGQARLPGPPGRDRGAHTGGGGRPGSFLFGGIVS